MKVEEICANCLYEKQSRMGNAEYAKEVRRILDSRTDEDTSPYLVYLFSQVYTKMFGPRASYKEEKKKFNDLVLSMEDQIRARIEASPDPLTAALIYARTGNYIDFGALQDVKEEEFLSLFANAEPQERDLPVVQSLLGQCARADTFLLIADNCGEIVLDKLFIEQLKKRFPHLKVNVMVRGEEVLNDVTPDDAEYVGLSNIAGIISNGSNIPGTAYRMLPDTAKEILDHSDVVLAKGQGNYESLGGQGRHVFYSFLCKCDLFTGRFQVPKFTGIFLEE